MVKQGTGVCFMPEDLHSIHIQAPLVNFHMYGLALEQLHHREYYKAKSGAWKIFPPHSDIREARESVGRAEGAARLGRRARAARCARAGRALPRPSVLRLLGAALAPGDDDRRPGAAPRRADRRARRRRRGSGRKSRSASLRELGYTDVSILEGGCAAWKRPAASSSAASTCPPRLSASSSSTTTTRRASPPPS